MNTEIILPVSELKQALHGLGKIIGRKTTLPVLQHVKIRRDNGLVTLQGTDLDAFATYTMNNTQSGRPVEVLVPLEHLNKALKSSGSKNDVTLIWEGKNTRLRYFIGGNPVEQPVNPLPGAEWPPLPEIKTDRTPMPPGFGEALKQAMACSSEDSSRVTLNGACLDASDTKAHYIVATNGRMLFAANSFAFPFKETVIVPDSKFINGSGILDGDQCLLAVQPGKKPDSVKHISLQNKNWQFVTREINGKFPNWKQVIPTINGDWTKVYLQPSAVSQLLQVIPNLPGRDGDTNPVRLRIEKTLWVEARNKGDAVWTKIAISDVEVTGKPRIICVNRNYLLPALKFGLNELAVLDDLSPMIARKEGKQMVIMPVRPTAIATTEKPSSPSSATPLSPTTTNERKTMPRIARIQTPAAPEATEAAQTNAIQEATVFIDQIRETVKSVLVNLNSIAGTLKKAEKQKKTGDKEIENVRSKLRQIQNVKI